tara:strand:- start:69 stop:659 length:591 start_codon:yes stop_codon:yes gene_type:complete
MSTLRIHGIEAKSDPTSASVNEKIKITNSNGDLLLHLDGTQSGIGTVGITTTGTTFHVDRATQEITFVSDAKFNGTVGIAGTLTYEDVSNIDSVGIITARTGVIVGSGVTLNATGVIATGVITATSFSGSGANLTNLPAGAPVGGASTNTVFFENDNSVDVNYSVTSGKNAMSAGPIEIKSGITVTVPSGSFWTIV